MERMSGAERAVESARTRVVVVRGRQEMIVGEMKSG